MMRRTLFFFMLLMFPALAQEEIFGYEILKETLEPAVAAYLGREVWAYGDLRLYCQNPVNTELVYRFYDTTPNDQLFIQNIVRARVQGTDWLELVHVNGGLTSIVDSSGIAAESAFLLTLATSTPITNARLFFIGNLSPDEFYISCQNFFTFIFPKADYLERVFSFHSIEELAREKGWKRKELDDVLDENVSVQLGMTRDMVLWKLGAPLRPLEFDEAMNAGHWYYMSSVPFSKDVTFDKETGVVTKYSEGRLP